MGTKASVTILVVNHSSAANELLPYSVIIVASNCDPLPLRVFEFDTAYNTSVARTGARVAAVENDGLCNGRL